LQVEVETPVFSNAAYQEPYTISFDDAIADAYRFNRPVDKSSPVMTSVICSGGVMRRTSLLIVFVFAAGLGVGFFARGAIDTTHETDTHAADLAAIEKLHAADIKATLTQDSTELINLWADDCVKLGVPGPALVGKESIQKVYEKFRADHPDFTVLKYAPEIQDLQVADGWAIEWVYYDATFKLSAKDNPVNMRRKDLRVLKRQNDGSWKFAREAETD
jgi:uncharacterized protein (TIGR02246 family)